MRGLVIRSNFAEIDRNSEHLTALVFTFTVRCPFGAEVAASTSFCAFTRDFVAEIPDSPKGLTVPGTSQGTPCPEQQTSFSPTSDEQIPRQEAEEGTSSLSNFGDIQYSDAVSRAKENIERVEKINEESGQRGRTWSIPVSPQMQSKTPIWSGRAQWQRQVREILNREEGKNLCRNHHTDPERVFAVAVSMASFADLRTGRRVTASREVLAERAGVSLTVLKRARRILAELGLAREMVRGRFLRTLEQWAAEAHHGRKQVKATSVWALVSPKVVVLRSTHDHTATAPSPARRYTKAAPTAGEPHRSPYPQDASRGPQSVALSFGTCTSVKKYKTTRASARRLDNSHKQPREPRSISLQKAAAGLIAHAPCLDTSEHIGAVCEALRDHCVDPERWSGRDIAAALTEDTRRRGWIWPTRDSLKHPIRYLRWRLVGIDWSLPSPTERAEAAKRLRDAERHAAAVAMVERAEKAASERVRVTAMARIRSLLQDKRSK